MHGVGVFNMTLQEGGAVLLERDGEEHLAEPDEGEDGAHVAFSDFRPYLILSHLAGHRFEVVGAQTTPAPRVDPDLGHRDGEPPQRPLASKLCYRPERRQDFLTKSSYLHSYFRHGT